MIIHLDSVKLDELKDDVNRDEYFTFATEGNGHLDYTLVSFDEFEELINNLFEDDSEDFESFLTWENELKKLDINDFLKLEADKNNKIINVLDTEKTPEIVFKEMFPLENSVLIFDIKKKGYAIQKVGNNFKKYVKNDKNNPVLFFPVSKLKVGYNQ